MMTQYASAARCKYPERPDNGRARVRLNVVRVFCNDGYTLIGQQHFTCDRAGRLSGERPVCASKYSTLKESKQGNGD